MQAKIQKWGNSQGIRIPKSLLEELKWAESEEIMLVVEKNNLIIKPLAKKRKNIKELFENYDGNYKPEDVDWGKPEGDEIW